MNKMKCIVSCPISTYSGYGSRSRDFVKALLDIRQEEWDIKILPQRWGNTRQGYLEDHKLNDLLSICIEDVTERPEIWIQITTANEFKPVGSILNVGVTAGIETDVYPHTWITGANQMDLVITSSTFSTENFKKTTYKSSEGYLTLKTPIESLFEGIVPIEPEYTLSIIDDIPESFLFLTVGAFLTGNKGADRKNIVNTVDLFIKSFNNTKKPLPGLVLKTQRANASIVDREYILSILKEIANQYKGNIPNIYLLHGELSEEDMWSLYYHPKVKAMVLLTRGEGFGRPLLEFSFTGKPIITTNWSGHLDFIDKKGSTLIPGKVGRVHPSAVVPDIIIPEASWFYPDPIAVKKAFKKIHKEYVKYKKQAIKQRYHSTQNFTFENMVELLDIILEKYLKSKPTKVDIKLPPLPPKQ